MRSILFLVLLPYTTSQFFGWPGFGCQCGQSYNPVCSQMGNTYPNECMAQCSGDIVVCDGICPCGGQPMFQQFGQFSGSDGQGFMGTQSSEGQGFMGFQSSDGQGFMDVQSSECNCGQDYDPVCTVSGDEYDNRCLAMCERQFVQCESKCPCT